MHGFISEERNCLKATEPLRRGSLLFTTKFPEILGTHLIDLRRMKGWANQKAVTAFIKKTEFKKRPTSNGPSNSCKMSKKIMSQSWETCCCKRQMDTLGHFGSFWAISGQARIFPKNSALSALSTYGPSNQQILRKIMW